MKNFILTIGIALSSLFLHCNPAVASNGFIELENVVGGDSKCVAMSTYFDRSNKYNIQMECTNLIYPIETNGKYYVLWAVYDDEDNTIKELDELGFGKLTTSTKKAFSELFITIEESKSPRTPSAQVIMQGFVEPINFLYASNNQIDLASTELIDVATNTPTPTVTVAENNQNEQTEKSKKANNLSTIIFILIFIIVIIIVFFVIFRYIRNLRSS